MFLQNWVQINKTPFSKILKYEKEEVMLETLSKIATIPSMSHENVNQMSCATFPILQSLTRRVDSPFKNDSI